MKTTRKNHFGTVLNILVNNSKRTQSCVTFPFNLNIFKQSVVTSMLDLHIYHDDYNDCDVIHRGIN